MSYRAYSTPSTRAQVATLLGQAQRAAADVRLDPRLDLDEARATLEDFLDTVAAWPSKAPLACVDCQEPLPEFRVCRWYPRPVQAPACFEPLCASCYAQRESAQDEAYFTRKVS